MPYQIQINDSGVIETQPISPEEEFISGDSSLKNKKILDYWIWAFSDLIGNTDRGNLAEYFVSMAVGSERRVRNSWAAYDVMTPDGMRIEVKSAAYSQAWHQEKPSDIQFSIRQTREWLPERNGFGEDRKRHSDVYVLCVLAEKDKSRLNPMDLSQWEFYVIATKLIDRDFGSKQSISLKQVKEYSDPLLIGQLSKVVNEVI